MFKNHFNITRRNVIIVFFVFLLPGLSPAQTIPVDDRLKGLEVYVDSALKEFRVAGCAVAIIEKNKIVFAKGFGYRDYENKLPVTANTVFPIASCTKAFTATLCGILANEGKLDLDKPVHDYYPLLKFYNEYTTAHATPRDLMSHRTGLPRHDNLVNFFDTSLPKDSLIYRFRYLEPSAELRQKAQYTNIMYIALGGLAEKITGLSWEQNTKQKILDPIGMTNTSFTVADLNANADHSFGYYRKNNAIVKGEHKNAEITAPAGGINSSVNDMAKWLITWMQGGSYNGKQVIPKNYLRQAVSLQMVNGNANYGLGWLITTYRGGHFKIEHGGDLPLFSSNICFYPGDSIGIVILTNQFGGYVTNLLRDYISDRMLNSKRPDLPGGDWTSWFKGYKDYYASNNQPAGVQEAKSSKQIAPLSHPKEDYAGTYMHPGYGIIKILVEQDSLSAMFNKVPLHLKHISYDIFEAKPGGRLRFSMDNNGKIISISMPLEESVADIVFKKEEG